MSRFAIVSIALSSLLAAFPSSSAFAHDPPHRHSAWGHYLHHQGLRITSVAYRSPASRAGLERGDVILEVDGDDIYTGDQLHRALHRTGYRGVLTVRDGRSGRIHRVQVLPVGGHIGITVHQAGW